MKNYELSNKRAADHDGYLFHLCPSIIEVDKFSFVHHDSITTSAVYYYKGTVVITLHSTD